MTSLSEEKINKSLEEILDYIKLVSQEYMSIYLTN